MIEADASGVMFTIDPVTNDQSKIVIEAIYGLGEMIVQGEITPDHYEIEKTTLTTLLRNIAIQTVQLMKQGAETKEVPGAFHEQCRQKITDEEILALARLGKQVEEHYQFTRIRKKNRHFCSHSHGGSLFVCQLDRRNAASTSVLLLPASRRQRVSLRKADRDADARSTIQLLWLYCMQERIHPYGVAFV